VTASVGGITYDNYHNLAIVNVVASALQPNSANLPGVAAAVVSNSTATTGATAVLRPGGSASFSGSYTSAPTNPAYSLAPPKFVIPSGVTVTKNSSTGSAASVTLAFPSSISGAQIYQVVFQGIGTSGGAAPAYQNYTWTVFVFAGGSVPAGKAAVKSPHPGSFVIYEYVPGTPTTADPAIDYETQGYEPILNIYQTLVDYNGSLTGPTYQSYVPDLATCVPGSPTCQSLYGSPLLSTDGINYTFVINKASQFYDPSTGAHWSVYPTDVVFSVIRTMGFSELPCWTCNNGWILTQALLPPAGTWDGGIHFYANNTPYTVFSHLLVNDSTNCPAAAVASQNGCVTFVANGYRLGQTAHLWPYFLELIADNLGASIVPAGFFSAAPQSAGIPGWTVGTVPGKGDGPVKLPGGFTSSSPAFLSFVKANLPATSWDSWEAAGSAPPFFGNVQFTYMGSGPYYMKLYSPGVSYLLQANPFWVQNPYCTYTGCKSAPGSYVPSVSVTWTTSALPGEAAYASGTADFATIPTTDTALALQLVQQGKIGITAYPTINIGFFPFTLNFNIPLARSFDTNAITIPADFFSSVGVRNFFAHAFPYSTVQNTINTVDGVTYSFLQWGAIPQFMANYYPTNISWPNGDPSLSVSTAGSAAWWWQQSITPGTHYYGPELVACTASSPCEFPVIGQLGAPFIDEEYSLWIQWVQKLTGGAIKMDIIDLTFGQEVVYSLFQGPFANPMPFYILAWAPDYPDPTDYVAPLYQRDGTYTASDTVWEALTGNFGTKTGGPGNSTYWSSSCHAADIIAGVGWGSATPLSAPITNLLYWGNLAKTGGGTGTPGIPQNCQGAAYEEMQWGMQVAAQVPAGTLRLLIYNMIEQLDNGLSLYTWDGQSNAVITYAPWINPTSFDPNITLGGVDNPWFFYTGNSVVHA
jgi:hypothetical protein